MEGAVWYDESIEDNNIDVERSNNKELKKKKHEIPKLRNPNCPNRKKNSESVEKAEKYHYEELVD
jgi:hypothetical protein